MKRIIILLCIVLGYSACQTEKPDLSIQGQIKGLKKGKIFLQQWKDSTIVNIDSVSLYNSDKFTFETKLDYPQIMYLQLQKDTLDPTDNFLLFFADKGQLKVNAKLNEFFLAEVEGNYANQKAFEKYLSTMKGFNNQKLDLIKAEMEARKNNDNQKLDSVNQVYNKMNSRRSLYALNFALGHPDLEVSPYAVLEYAQYIKKPYLDSVYNKLDKKVKKSFYGQQLKEVITP